MERDTTGTVFFVFLSLTGKRNAASACLAALQLGLRVVRNPGPHSDIMCSALEVDSAEDPQTSDPSHCHLLDLREEVLEWLSPRQLTATS